MELFDFEKVVQQVSKITLKGGLVGKVCHVLMFVAIAIAAMAWVAKNIWVSGVGIGLLFVLVVVVLWRLINFARKNPQAALLEGAEFLLHEQLRLGKKGSPILDLDSSLAITPDPLKMSNVEKQNVLKPDVQNESEKGSIESQRGRHND